MRLKGVFVHLSLLATLAGAFFLRLFKLGEQELRGDEGFGYFFSLHAFDEIIKNTMTLNEPHPVASYFIQHVWLDLAGHSEFALRFMSAWFGVLAVALLYRLGRQLNLNAPSALLGAALLAVSPYAIWHSQDARMYAMSLALTIGSTWLALEIWPNGTSRPAPTPSPSPNTPRASARRIGGGAGGGGRWYYWLAYIAVSWLALHTHYFAAFIIVVQNIFIFTYTFVMFLTRSNDVITSPIGFWVSAQIMLALSYAPWLWQVYDILTSYSGNGDSPTFEAFVWRSLSVFAVGESVPLEQRPWFGLLAGLLLLLALVKMTLVVRERRAGWLLTLYLVVPLVATWLSAQERPIFNERYLIAASAPFYLLVATAIEGWSGSRLSLGIEGKGRHHFLRFVQGVLFLLLLAGMGASLQRHYTDPAYSKSFGWRELAQGFETLTAGMPTQQVRLAENFPDPTLWYYYRGPIEHVVLPPAPHDAAGAERIVEALVTADVRRVMISLQPMAWWDNQSLAESALASAYTLADERKIGSWPSQLYVRINPEALQPLGARFENGLTLQAAALEPTQGQFTVAGGVVIVHLRWQGDIKGLAGSEKLFIHLLDGNGVLVAQNDQPFTTEELTAPVSSLTILLPETLAAGDYRVVTGLYDPGLPNAPRILRADGTDMVQLGVVQVASSDQSANTKIDSASESNE